MFDRSPDQELFEETTRRFLDAEAPLHAARSLAGTKSGFEPAYWRDGAELGWTSLLVPEESGGGSVSGAGIADMTLLAHQFGLHVAPGPLLPANTVAAALARWGQDAHGPVLSGILAGERVGAWALGEPGSGDRLGTVATQARVEGGSILLNGVKAPVEAGAEASDILVTANEGSGLSQFLVPADAPGLTVTPLQGLDLTKRFARLHFDTVRLPASSRVGAPGQAAEAVDWLTDIALIMQLAEVTGCMSWCLDTTLEWAHNRYSFGRPLASYQEIKHRFADMKMWLEAAYGIVADAAAAADEGSTQRAELVSAAKTYIGHVGPELVQDCVQIHGGIGVTFDHDLHLFLRRVTTAVPLFGAPAEHARRVGRMLRTHAHRGPGQPASPDQHGSPDQLDQHGSKDHG